MIRMNLFLNFFIILYIKGILSIIVHENFLKIKRMKKQYIFIVLLIILLYLLLQIWIYKYNEYKIYTYMQELSYINDSYQKKIEEAKKRIDKITTPAYINKSLKSEQGLKNQWENMLTLITQERYNTYTSTGASLWEESATQTEDPLSHESLIGTMTHYEKWIYLIFKKDIR